MISIHFLTPPNIPLSERSGAGLRTAFCASVWALVLCGFGIPRARDGGGIPKALDGAGIPRTRDGGGIPAGEGWATGDGCTTGEGLACMARPARGSYGLGFSLDPERKIFRL